HLVGVFCKVAGHWRALGNRVAVAIVIVDSLSQWDHTEQAGHGIVIVADIARIDLGIAIGRVAGIERRRVLGVGEAGTGKPVRIGLAAAEGVVQIAFLIAQEGKLQSDLPGVASVYPGNIVREIVHRTLERGRARDALIEGQEVIPLLGGIADCAEALANEAVAETVDERRSNHRGIADNDSLVVIHGVLFRRSTRQERGLGRAFIGKSAAYRQALLGVGGDV